MLAERQRLALQANNHAREDIGKISEPKAQALFGKPPPKCALA